MRTLRLPSIATCMPVCRTKHSSIHTQALALPGLHHDVTYYNVLDLVNHLNTIKLQNNSSALNSNWPRLPSQTRILYTCTTCQCILKGGFRDSWLGFGLGLGTRSFSKMSRRSTTKDHEIESKEGRASARGRGYSGQASLTQSEYGGDGDLRTWRRTRSGQR